MVLRNFEKVTISWSLGQSKWSYYQFFFDATFLKENKKYPKVSKFVTFGFRQKKFHQKKSDNTISFLGPESPKLAIFPLFWGPKFGLARIIFSVLPRTVLHQKNYSEGSKFWFSVNSKKSRFHDLWGGGSDCIIRFFSIELFLPKSKSYEFLNFWIFLIIF